jgi:signal transduction histidine kinase
MARATEGAAVAEGNDGDSRWTLFLRSQVPILGTAALLLAVPASLGVEAPRPGLLVVGFGVLVLAAAATLALPWDRYPPVRQSALAGLDLIGIAVIAVAMFGAIDHLSLIAAFPAVWLAVIGGTRAAAVGIAGTFLAAIVPVFVAGEADEPIVWASVLVVPVVVSVIVWVAAVLTDRVRRSTEGLRRALEELSSATAESHRAGAVMQSFAEEIDLGMAFVPVDDSPPFFNTALENFSALAGIDGAIGIATRCYYEDQVTPVPPEDQPLTRMLRGDTITDALFWVGPRARLRALLCNGRPVFGTDGERTGSVVVVQDVTELLKAERSREDALTTLAHELRTPLTSIVGYTDLLSAESLSPAAAARVEVIARNAEHLLVMTTAFLDHLHRPPELKFVSTNARELVDDAVAVLQTTPGFTERELHIDVSSDLLVSADRAAMGIVLANLLNNAVKFSAPGDSIRISAGEDDEFMWLTVHDTGSRIETEDLERIFDRFYRGANAQRDAVQGTGIGLSISREIVVAHGGALTAEEVDEGACFRITLPRL